MLRPLLFALTLIVFSLPAAGQTANPRLPYQTQPGLPPLRLLLADSSSWFETHQVPDKKPMLLIFFSPGCSHCQQSTEELLQLKDSLPDMQLVLATMASISEMNAFRTRYRTELLPRTVIGKDVYTLLPPYFGIRHLPFLALYGRKHELAEIIDGALPMRAVMEKVRVQGTQ